jgi:hypothetical protein
MARQIVKSDCLTKTKPFESERLLFYYTLWEMTALHPKREPLNLTNHLSKETYLWAFVAITKCNMIPPGPIRFEVCPRKFYCRLTSGRDRVR